MLLANLPAYGLPGAAAFSPAAWGGRQGWDLFAWFATLVLVEGRMRGLFSMLFGASILLAAARTEADGRDPATDHFARMGALFALGLAHLYLLWWGDILAHYALVGCAAFAFREAGVRALLAAGAALVALQAALALDLAADAFAALPGSAPWAALQAGFGTPPPNALAAEVSALGGSFADGVAWRWRTAPSPLDAAVAGGAETLSYMLFGMAAFRSGMLTGGWSRPRYRRWAASALLPGLPAYAALGWVMLAHGLDARWVLLCSYAFTVPLRPFVIAGYACALMLALPPDGRLAAAGRAALSNYLGTTLVMAFVFGGWGLGLFGRPGRAELYWLAIPAWALMLWWPSVWFARFRLGPAEWAWRSLARLRPLPLRR